MLIRKRPDMGTPKNNNRMPENSINVPISGFILLFPPFLYNYYFITAYKSNKGFLINTEISIV